MAPSASMLFLSYHQLHSHRPTEAGAPPQRREEAAVGSGFRMSVRSVLSLPLFQRRPEEAAVPAEGKTATLHERDAREEVKSSATAAADADKELERKFEEALRLSCWSS
ncbi:hypothetical protein BDA96_01G112200 [Sorghum bicolor]|uniref:Uncharacterized protein n=1 Tax=Sorghum bicolor TaxID=4558 RepID=A0A921UZR5_SORBI|nr:hypothetical protein BDA96_01G112200 [Sorghum bicolor]